MYFGYGADDGYTELVSERTEDLIDAADVAKMWADMWELGETADSEKWKAKLKAIAGEYLLSSRFALMRLLHKRLPAGTLPRQGREPTIDDAQNLSPEEHMAYIRCLLELAGPSPQQTPDLHEQIILRAWHDEESANAVMLYYLPGDDRKQKKSSTRIEKENKKRYGAPLTREEALQLGHILKFTLPQMQWYLMRVLDVEDGLRMNSSSDLVEAYCFLTGGDCRKAAELKTVCKARIAHIEKWEDIPDYQNWTAQTGDALPVLVQAWQRVPTETDERFLSWMEKRAPGLDVPSRTALRVYRNLAAFAYSGNIPPEEELKDELLDISGLFSLSDEAEEFLFEDGRISKKKCDQVAESLYLGNKFLTGSGERDSTKVWSVITLRKDRELSASYGAVNTSRNRIQSLLYGDSQVEKGDILYLLWYTLNIAWEDAGAVDAGTICNRVFDLKDAAAALLKSALLPPFYPPHLMEQSMLLSIIYAGKQGTDPAVVYGTLLESLRETRARDSGSKKHTLSEQIEIITHYRQSKDMTLKQCALLYGVSEQTLSRWQADLLRQGLIPETE